ncbi:MAG: YggT family protein [Candidatus Woesebacteria bacterium]
MSDDVVRKETTTTKNTSVNAPGAKVESQTVVSGASETVAPSQTVVYAAYFLLSCVEILLAFRLILKMTGANPASGFVSFIYSISGLFVFPFQGIFHAAVTQGLETAAVFEPAALVAMVVYAIFVWMLVQLFMILTGKPQDKV